MHTAHFVRAALLAMSLLLALAVPVSATGQETVSAPNGDFFLRIVVGSTTDKDEDGNQDTAAKPDKLLVRYEVFRQNDVPQTVELTINIDRPGVAFDEQITDTIDLVNFTGVIRFVEDKVQSKWETGAYTVTISATNGSDQAVVSGSVSIG